MPDIHWMIMGAFVVISIVSLREALRMVLAALPRHGGRHRRLQLGRAFRWIGAWEISVGLSSLYLAGGNSTWVGPTFLGVCFLVSPSIKAQFDRVLAATTGDDLRRGRG